MSKQYLYSCQTIAICPVSMMCILKASNVSPMCDIVDVQAVFVFLPNYCNMSCINGSVDVYLKSIQYFSYV